MRETVESIVIAFVLAFLVSHVRGRGVCDSDRLDGADADGPAQGRRLPEVRLSLPGQRERRRKRRSARDAPSDCVAGMCPMCHYVMPMRPDLPGNTCRKSRAATSTFSGRTTAIASWSTSTSTRSATRSAGTSSCSSFPATRKMNYIKRLVGLPGETLRIYQGDVFVGDKDATRQTKISRSPRKPPDKVLAMRQLVHDTNYDPAELDAAGWPLRWQPIASGDARRLESRERRSTATTCASDTRVDAAARRDGLAALRAHWCRTYDVWQRAGKLASRCAAGISPQPFGQDDRGQIRPRLITDANPYNGRVDRSHGAGQRQPGDRSARSRACTGSAT